MTGKQGAESEEQRELPAVARSEFVNRFAGKGGKKGLRFGHSPQKMLSQEGCSRRSIVVIARRKAAFAAR